MTIFKRRKKQKFLKKLKEVLWPTQGWKRSFHYYRHRLFRSGDSTYRITAGLALGASVSFTPLIGTHIIQAAFLAVPLRASFLAAFIGTAFGNPWTFPFLFWLGYKTGVIIMSFFGWSDFLALPDFMTHEYFTDHPADFMRYLLAHPLNLFVPMVVGGYICGIIFWPLAYGILYYPVKMAQKAYHSKKMQRLLHREKT